VLIDYITVDSVIPIFNAVRIKSPRVHSSVYRTGLLRLAMTCCHGNRAAAGDVMPNVISVISTASYDADVATEAHSNTFHSNSDTDT